jgi:hypothetical protein
MNPHADSVQQPIDDLAQAIRLVDGSHTLGAGALAEALMPFILARFGTLPAAEPSQSGSAGEAELLDEAAGIAMGGWHSVEAGRAFACKVTDYILSRQAPAAPAEAVASLRHLYENMLNGAVRDTASAKRIATGLLGPAIEKLERAAPIEPAKTEAPARIVDHIPADAATLLKELKNIAHDEDQPLGNRLQMISARISNFWDALSTPPTPEAEPVQQDTKGGAA